MSSRYDQREWARLERLRAIGFTPTGTNGELAAKLLSDGNQAKRQRHWRGNSLPKSCGLRPPRSVRGDERDPT